MCLQRPTQFYRNQHTFELQEELDKAAQTFVYYMWQYKFVAMNAVSEDALFDWQMLRLSGQ